MPREEHTSSTSSSRGNPRAAQARIELKRAGAYDGQRKHDMRTGAQPAYVDQERAGLNDVLIEPPRPAAIRQVNEARRNVRETKRAMKKDAAVAAIGILTFGAEASATFSALPREKQNAAFLDAAQAIADRLNTSLVGLVVHRDETSPHAHFTLPAYDLDGLPLSKTIKRATLQDIQTITAAAFARHAPGIERGFTVSERAAAGADKHDLRHRSVRELHADLPAELEAARAATKAAQEKADEMATRVRKLEEKQEHTTAELKRLNTYRKRLDDRIAVLREAKAEAERIAAAAMKDAAEAKAEASRARAEAEETRAKAAEDAAQMRAEASAAKEEAEASRAEANALRDTLRKTIGAFKTLARRLGLTGPQAEEAAAAITYAETLTQKLATEPAAAPEEADEDRPRWS